MPRSNEVTVTAETYGYDDGPDVLVIRLGGEELYAATIVEHAERERADLERVVRRIERAAEGRARRGLLNSMYLRRLTHGE